MLTWLLPLACIAAGALIGSGMTYMPQSVQARRLKKRLIIQSYSELLQLTLPQMRQVLTAAEAPAPTSLQFVPQLLAQCALGRRRERQLRASLQDIVESVTALRYQTAFAHQMIVTSAHESGQWTLRCATSILDIQLHQLDLARQTALTAMALTYRRWLTTLLLHVEP